jgi:hypothetical protein
MPVDALSCVKLLIAGNVAGIHHTNSPLAEELDTCWRISTPPLVETVVLHDSKMSQVFLAEIPGKV